MTASEIHSNFPQTDAQLASLARAQERTEIQLAKTDAILTKLGERTDAQLAKLGEKIDHLTGHVDGISKSQGMDAEEFFLNTLEDKLSLGGIEFDSVMGRVRRKSRGQEVEIDALLENGKSAALVEIKHRFRQKDLAQVHKALAVFRDLFPHLRNHQIYAGVAAYSYEDQVIEQAQEAGFIVLKRVGDVMEVNAQAMRAF